MQKHQARPKALSVLKEENKSNNANIKDADHELIVTNDTNNGGTKAAKLRKMCIDALKNEQDNIGPLSYDLLSYQL